MKVIDLINMKYNKEKMPKHIIINRMNYIYDTKTNKYYDEDNSYMVIDFTDNVLNMKVKIIKWE